MDHGVRPAEARRVVRLARKVEALLAAHEPGALRRGSIGALLRREAEAEADLRLLEAQQPTVGTLLSEDHAEMRKEVEEGDADDDGSGGGSFWDRSPIGSAASSPASPQSPAGPGGGKVGSGGDPQPADIAGDVTVAYIQRQKAVVEQLRREEAERLAEAEAAKAARAHTGGRSGSGGGRGGRRSKEVEVGADGKKAKRRRWWSSLSPEKKSREATKASGGGLASGRGGGGGGGGGARGRSASVSQDRPAPRQVPKKKTSFLSRRSFSLTSRRPKPMAAPEPEPEPEPEAVVEDDEEEDRARNFSMLEEEGEEVEEGGGNGGDGDGDDDDDDGSDLSLDGESRGSSHRTVNGHPATAFAARKLVTSANSLAGQQAYDEALEHYGDALAVYDELNRVHRRKVSARADAGGEGRGVNLCEQQP